MELSLTARAVKSSKLDGSVFRPGPPFCPTKCGDVAHQTLHKFPREQLSPGVLCTWRNLSAAISCLQCCPHCGCGTARHHPLPRARSDPVRSLSRSRTALPDYGREGTARYEDHHDHYPSRWNQHCPNDNVETVRIPMVVGLRW